jgi:membrane protease subunit HflK
LPIIIILALIGWLATGIYTIQPGEAGVVRTFGSYSGPPTGAGLNYRFPSPIQSVIVVDTQTVRRTEIGFRTDADSETVGKRSNLAEALMLTSDENIVQVELLVQYRISDAADFVFNVQNPEGVLRTSAEVALRSAVGNMTIDAVITEERGKVQMDTKANLERLLLAYNIGIDVGEVLLQVADPPEEVRDAFQEVVRARADKERLINEAQAYQNDVVPRANGQAEQLINTAKAFEAARIAEAEGEADRFLAFIAGLAGVPGQEALTTYLDALELTSALAEEQREGARKEARSSFLAALEGLDNDPAYISRRNVMSTRLYLETMERILPNAKKFILTPDSGSNLLQFLPLEGSTFVPPVVSTQDGSVSEENN